MTGQSETTTTGAAIRRVTTVTAACVIVSNMIGTGIFGTTGFMARDLGSPGLILGLWAFGGLYALLGAICYSELGAALPRAGGEYIYIREAFGPLWGFLSGWTSLTIGFSAAIASNAHLFAKHLVQLFPVLAGESEDVSVSGIVPRAIGLAMVWLLTAVHLAGVGAGGLVQRWLTFLKVGGMTAFFLAGVSLGSGSWGHYSTGTVAFPELGVLAISFFFVTFGYSGWNAAGYIAGEMIEPGRSIPRAALAATGVVAILYLAMNAVYLYALPLDQLAAEPIAAPAHKAATALFGMAAGRWITALLCVSILGAASAMIWAGPRIYFAMAQDGVLPHFFAQTSDKTQAPARAILLQSLWVSVLVVVGDFEKLVVYTGFAITVFTSLAVASVILLRARQPELARPYRVRYHPVVPAVYLLISLVVIWSSLRIGRTEPYWGIATVAAGVPFYLVFLGRRLK